MLYRVLAALTRGRIDRLRVPAPFEWPQLLLALVLVAAAPVVKVAATLAQG